MLAQQVLPEDASAGTPPRLTQHLSPEAGSIVAALEAAQQQQGEAGLLALRGSRSSSPLHSVGGNLSGGWSQMTQQHLQELQQQLNSGSAAEQPAAACPFCDGANHNVRQLCTVAGVASGCGRQGCPAAAQAFYGEMHDSSGSVPYVGVTPGLRQQELRAAGRIGSDIAPAAAGSVIEAGATRRRAPPRRAASFGGGLPAASAMAGAAGDGSARRVKGGPKRSVSFRLEPSQQQQAADAAAGAVTGGQPSKGVYEAPEGFADDASVCSAATMATWVSGSTHCTGTSCSSDASGSITGAEKLFDMTGACKGGGGDCCGLPLLVWTPCKLQLIGKEPEACCATAFNCSAAAITAQLAL
jgi:hypothetical protein